MPVQTRSAAKRRESHIVEDVPPPPTCTSGPLNHPLQINVEALGFETPAPAGNQAWPPEPKTPTRSRLRRSTQLHGRTGSLSPSESTVSDFQLTGKIVKGTTRGLNLTTELRGYGGGNITPVSHNTPNAEGPRRLGTPFIQWPADMPGQQSPLIPDASWVFPPQNMNHRRHGLGPEGTILLDDSGRVINPEFENL